MEMVGWQFGVYKNESEFNLVGAYAACTIASGVEKDWNTEANSLEVAK